MIVERTDFMSVPVTDLERSARFYEETLGLPKNPGSGAWPEFETGNVSPRPGRERVDAAPEVRAA